MGKINPIQLHGTAVELETIILSALNLYETSNEKYNLFGGALYANEIEKSPYIAMTMCLISLYDKEKESSEKINGFLNKYYFYKTFSIEKLNNSNDIDLKELINEFKELLKEIKSQ